MSDYETTANQADEESVEERPLRNRLSYYVGYVMRRVVVLLSFGPGILGVLWLFGRILKR